MAPWGLHRDRGPPGQHQSSGQSRLPGGRRPRAGDQDRPRRLLPGRGRRRTARVADRPMILEAVRQGHHRGGDLPEARPGETTGLDRRRRTALRAGHLGQGGGGPGSRRDWCGRSTSAAWTSTRIRCVPATWTIPTSCASTWIRCPASDGHRSSTWRRWRARSRGPWADGLAQDLGSRGFHIYARIAPRWPFKQVRLAAETVGARSSAGHPSWPPATGGRRTGRGCSSTSTRTRRTARWPRPIRCGRRRTPGCRCR